MTKKLEETLDLPSLSEALEKAKENKQEEKDVAEEAEALELQETLSHLRESQPSTAEGFKQALDAASTLENAVARHAEFKEHDDEMNEVSEEAMESYQTLMDYAMNCTPAHAGKIFETATQMLTIAMNARNSKSDKKLKVWRLQIEQARLMRDLEKQRDDTGEIVDNGPGVKGTRNAILAGIKDGSIPLDDN